MHSIQNFFQNKTSSLLPLQSLTQEQDAQQNRKNRTKWSTPLMNILGVSFTKTGATPGLAETCAYAPGIS